MDKREEELKKAEIYINGAIALGIFTFTCWSFLKEAQPNIVMSIISLAVLLSLAILIIDGFYMVMPEKERRRFMRRLVIINR